jgi:hypothetical protein
MNRTILTAAAVALVCASAPAIAKDKKTAPVNIDAPAGSAQPIAASWPAGVAPTTPTITANAYLPTNSELVVRMNSELNSKKAREGSTFIATVAYDVMLGNVVVVPKGTPVNGVVTWRTGKGAFGKSAKMEYELRSFDLAGQRYALSGKFRQEGKGNTGAAVGAVVAVGVFGAFVTGKSAIVEQGRELKVYTTTVIPVLLPGSAAAPAPVAMPAATAAAPVATAQPASATK